MHIGISFQFPSLFSCAPLESEPHLFHPFTFADVIVCYLFFKHTQLFFFSTRKLPAKFYKISCLNIHVLKRVLKPCYPIFSAYL